MPDWRRCLKSLWEWLKEGIPGDIRSIVVSSVVAAVITMVTTAWIGPEPLHFSAFANAQGYTQALEPLNNAVSKSGETVEFEFQPPELRKAYVCEFAQVEATTHRQLMLSYLSDTRHVLRFRRCLRISIAFSRQDRRSTFGT